MKLALGILSVLAICSVSCSPEASKQYVKPHLDKTQVFQDPNIQYFDPTVDILFVVDNSSSMLGHQQRLADNIALFTDKFFKNSILNFHIGVVSTDGDCTPNDPFDSCDFPGGLLIGNTKVITNSTPNLNQTLSANLKIGIGGSGYEKMFRPVVMGLDPATLAGPNAGFYRPASTLALIFITDADDQSGLTLNETAFYQKMLDLKGQDKRLILSYGVIIPTTEVTGPNCQRDPIGLPNHLEAYLGMVRNGANRANIFSLCDDQFGPKLAGLAKDIVDNVGNTFFLSGLPDVDTIRVTYGSLELPKDPDTGWKFDSARNAVVLGDKIDWSSQPSGSRVKVNYELATVDTEIKQ